MDIEDPRQLTDYLQARGLLPLGEEADMRVLAGGVSNKTVWLRRPEPPDWVLKQALPKLRVKDDWFSDVSRIHREAEGIRVLAGLAPAGIILPFVFEDEAAHILAMDAAPEPYTNWKSELLAGRVDDSLVEAFGRILGQIHRRFDTAAYPSDGLLRDRSFFESLRLAPYYQASAERAPEAAPFIEALIRETRASAVTIVHGDYSPKNVLVHAGRLILLDHEVIHIGDPAFDVGFSLTHFLSKAHHLPEKRTRFADAARRHWAAYEAEAGGVDWFDGVERRAVAHTLACLLARVVGRSPLEYLDEVERRRQRDAVVMLMGQVPARVEELIGGFLREIHT